MLAGRTREAAGPLPDRTHGGPQPRSLRGPAGRGEKPAGLPLRTWEAYCLAFNERSLLRRELHRIEEGRGSKEIHPEVLERLQALRAQYDPIVGQLRKFMPADPPTPEDRERQEM